MFRSAPRWLQAIVLLALAAFGAELIAVYGVRYVPWLESDATVPVLLAARSLHSGLPVATDWYYGNGDVWVIAPQLVAILPVALLGIGQASLWISTVAGFAIELYAFVRVYAWLAGVRWIGGLAAFVTLAAWSKLHIRFVYVQLAYGFGAVLYLLVFAAFAARAVEPERTWRRLAGLAALIVLGAVQNPTRGLVFVLAPLLVGCAWPWRGLSGRRRLVLAGAAIAGWLVAAALYHVVLQRLVSFAYPAGHTDFVLVHGWREVGVNLRRLWQGTRILIGASKSLWLMAPTGLVVLGGLALVGRELVRARERTALRVVCVLVIAQLGIVFVPLVVGNLMIAPTSVRYLMSSQLLVLGLAAVLAVRAVAEPARAWRALAIGWLVLAPIGMALAIGKSRPPAPRPYEWANPRELPALGAELARRGLSHGFSNLVNANLLAYGGRGAVRICPLYFSYGLIPQRWLADTRCYDRAALPERFFVVTDHDASDEAALRATLPPPEERFHVGPSYEVALYRTAAVPLAWLTLPIHDGEELALPLRLPASHPALERGAATADGDRLIATGAPGSVVRGPALTVPRGAYRVTWTGQALASPGRLTFRVVAGAAVLAETTVDSAATAAGAPLRVELRFTAGHQRIDALVISGGGARLAIDDVVLERP